MAVAKEGQRVRHRSAHPRGGAVARRAAGVHHAVLQEGRAGVVVGGEPERPGAVEMKWR